MRRQPRFQLATAHRGALAPVLAVVTAMSAVALGGASVAFAATACPEPNPDLLAWTVPLNSTGIGDQKFINPRAPFDWLKRVKTTRGWSDDEDSDIKKAKPFYEGCLKEVRLAFRNDTAGRSFLVGFPFKLKTEKAMKAELAAAVEELQQTLLAAESAAPVRGPAPPAGLIEEVQTFMVKAETAEQEEAADSVVKPSSFECETCKAKQIAERAVASGIPLAKTQGARLARLISQIETSLGIQESLIGDLEEQCQKPAADGTRTCSLQIGVPAGLTQYVSPEEWGAITASARNVIKFTVTFFDEEGTPSNPTGYIRVGQTAKEEASTRSWSLTAGIGATRAPLVSRKDAAGKPVMFTVDDPYRGDRTRSFPGTGRLTLVQTYNSLATANVDLTFKSGDLGEADTTRELVATKYDVRVFGTKGFSVRGGKFALAVPSDGLAIRESGDAFELVLSRFNNISIGHLVKRESIEGVADDANLDSDVWILQARNLPVTWGPIVSADYTILFGRENKKDQTPYDYKTLGGEIRFAHARGFDRDRRRDYDARKQGGSAAKAVPPDDSATVVARPVDCTEQCAPAGSKVERKPETTYRWPFSGSLAVYESDRSASGRPVIVTPPKEGEEPKETKLVPDGSGSVGLLTLKWTRVRIDERQADNGAAFFKTKAERSFRLRLGQGTGDDPLSPEDEGYLGETAAFSPDKIFLSRFAAALDSGGMGQIGRGLSNKAYAELTYTDHTWSIFRRLALCLTEVKPETVKEDPKKDPIVTQATIFKAHAYRFEEPVLGSRDAGFEVGIDFEIQVPKGVKATFGFGQFFPGEALEELINEDPYIVTLTTSVTLN